MSELFKTKSGLSTFNAGMAWYGPYQYVELFVQVIEKYVNVQEGQTQYATFCFFSGNDIRDIQEYERWLDGGAYYKYLPQQNFLERYITAMSDILRALIPDILKRAIRSIFRTPIDYKDDLGFVTVADEQKLMRFAYWNEKRTADQLLESKEWEKLRELLKQFADIANKNHIIPIVLYIPTKLQVYGNLYVNNKSGVRFIANIEDQLKYEKNSLEAIKSMTTELDIRFVDLFSYFKELALYDELLYYPFDTHWNINGRKHAAKYLYDNMGINP